MMEFEELKGVCLRLLERLDSSVDDDYSENVIQEVVLICGHLAKSGAQLEERFPDLMEKIEMHFFKMFLCVDHVHFYVR